MAELRKVAGTDADCLWYSRRVAKKASASKTEVRYQLPAEIAAWYSEQAGAHFTSRSAFLRAQAIETYRQRTEHNDARA